MEIEDDYREVERENMQAIKDQEYLDSLDKIDEYPDELKKTVSRSFSRKLNLGNYETADFFCAYSQELLGSTTLNEVKQVSHRLYIEAKHDVLRAMEAFKTMSNEDLPKLYEKVRAGIPIPAEIWQELSAVEQNLLHKAQLLKAQEDRNSAKTKNANLSPTSNGVKA